MFDEQLHPKLIDFGLSKENSNVMHTYCGTTFYMAPEIFQTDTYDGMKADVWAIGVTLNLLNTLHYPWYTTNEYQFMNEMKEGKLEMVIVSTGIIGTIIKKCLIKDPVQRPTIDELLSLMEQNQQIVLSTSSIRLDRNTYPAVSLPKLIVKNPISFYAKPRKLNEKAFPRKGNIKFRRSLNI